MKKPPATIKDIARILNISTSTVSRALTGQTNISTKTKKEILELAERLDYEPNSIALSLKQRRTNIIGVIIPETENKFYAKAISGIQQIATKHGYNVMICQSHESYEIEKKNVQTLVSNRVDGLIIALSSETKNYEHLEKIHQKGFPIVFFDRICEELATSNVVCDNYEGMIRATTHLIQVGCKRIAHIAGPQNLYDCRRRYEGYLEALKRENLKIDKDLIIFSNFDKENVKNYTAQLLDLKQPPDAILAINDSTAVEMMYIIKKRGLKVPEDIAIIGFNNDYVSSFVEPPLTSIEFHPFEVGKIAALILVKNLKREKFISEEKVVKSQLIIRESSFKSIHK
jgi:DNA-binding LacI/PurR family transcriptional regulator